MRFLITGGAGFIGGHLCEALLKAGHEVTVIDNLSTGTIDNLKTVINHEKLHFIQDDILTMSNLDEVISQVDIIYHLAAAVGVELVVHDPIQTIITNVHGTENVLKAAMKFNKRTIVASTSEVYGKSTHDEFNEKDDLLIGCPQHSRWSYACSKLLDEFYVMALYHTYKFPGTVVRFFNTVGPRQTGQYGMVIPRFVLSAINNNDIMVYGDGTQSRCFCHVFDTVRALLKLAKCEESYGNIYNIGSQHSISIGDLAKQVVATLGSKSEIKLLPYDQAYEKGFEDMMRRKPDTAAVRELLDWQPELSLETIIQDVADSIRSGNRH